MNSQEGSRQNMPIARGDSRRVVVVEASPSLGPLLSERLRDEGFDVVSTPSLASALDGSDRAVVVVAAPEASPLAHELGRRSGRTTPAVIALISAGTQPPAGIVAWLERPARLETLMAAIRAIPREPPVEAALGIGPLMLDAKTRLLTDRSGMDRIRLTEKEAYILWALIQAPDREIGRDALMRDIWRYHDAVQSHTMETHIYRLRRKLTEADPSLAGAIETIAGGYRLRLDPKSSP